MLKDVNGPRNVAAALLRMQLRWAHRLEVCSCNSTVNAP